MTRTHSTFIVTGCLAARVVLTVATLGASMAPAFIVAAQAQGGERAGGDDPAPVPGPIPRMPDGKPDLNGVWWVGVDGVNPHGTSLAERLAEQRALEAAGGAGQLSPLQRLYTPEAQQKIRTLGDKDDPALRCVPAVTQGTETFQIVQSPKFVALLLETYHGWRLVPIEAGREHNADQPPVYRGDSVGRWDGDTLVVSVNNFTDKNWLVAEGQVSFHSDALTVTERYRRVNHDTLEVEATYEDPKVMAKPWTARRLLQLAPFDQILEVLCVDTSVAPLMGAAALENYGRKDAPATTGTPASPAPPAKPPTAKNGGTTKK